MEYKKPSLLHLEGDPYESAPGFNFNRNDFEDLIDNFTPLEDIPILLGVSHGELDTFCNYIYRTNFKVTYENLLRRSQLYYRKAMMSLSKSGNPTAIKVSAEYYVGLGTVDKSEQQIVFLNEMPDSPSDLDRLIKKQGQSEQENQIKAVEKVKEELK